MEKINLTCIGCPLGCEIQVTKEGDEILEITGQTCVRGEQYARKEVTNPTRTVTSVVPVRGSATCSMVSVKTAEDVPRDCVLGVVDSLRDVSVEAPVLIGDVIVPNVCGTGVDVVATKNC